MAICQFFLQGRCRFGERCWNEHPRGGVRYGPSATSYQGTSRGGGGWGSANQKHSNVIQPSTFKSNVWGGSRDYGRGLSASSGFGSSGGSSGNADFSQNRFSVLVNSQNNADGYKDEEERLLESVVKDMETWESSGQWIFSSYSPVKEKLNVSAVTDLLQIMYHGPFLRPFQPLGFCDSVYLLKNCPQYFLGEVFDYPLVTGFRDFSPEELHLEYYNCRANNNIQNYINSVQQLADQWKTRLLQLKVLNASTKAALLSELKNTVTQSLPAFGFGGQQSLSFGLSSFPVISSSSSVSSFSFKTSSSLINASSGNTPAFGSSSAGCNPPAFGATSSLSVSQSAGFGSPAAPSAASFSFKTSEATSGFGSSGFSGLGTTSAVSSSNITPPKVFGDFSAPVATSPSHSSSTLFGQNASASGQTLMSASSAVTNNTSSEKLFTPKSELSAEDLKQFEAKKFTIGKIPLKPPPLELLNI